MAIGRITGSVLKSNLTRNGVDLAFETNLLYLDVTNSRVGIGTSEPSTTLHVVGNTTMTGTLDISGALTVGSFSPDTISLNNISSADSTAIQVNDGMNVSGALNAKTIVTNSIGSEDSTAIQVNDAMNVSGTITANSGFIANGITYPTTDGSNGQVLQTNGEGLLTFADAGGGGGGNNTATRQFSHLRLTTGSTVIDEFDIQEYRAAIYHISTEDVTNSLTGLTTLSVVHDGSTAYSNQHESNEDSTNLALFSVSISGTKVQISAQANAQSSHVNLRLYRIALGDHHDTVANTNSKIIVTTTAIGSTAVTLDQFTKTNIQGAKYYILIKDSTAGQYQFSQLSLVHDGSTAYFHDYAKVLTNLDQETTFSADISGSTVNLKATSGGSTTGTAIMYRIDLGSATKLGEYDGMLYGKAGDVDSAAQTIDSFDALERRTAKYLVTVANTDTGTYQNSEITMVTDGNNAFITESLVLSGTNTLTTFTADVTGGRARLRAAGSPANNEIYFARLSSTKPVIYRATNETIDNFYLDGQNIQINASMNVSGTLTAANITNNSLVTNEISTSDSTAIQVNDAMNISGALTANSTVTFNAGYVEKISALSSSSTITVNCALAPVHKVTLTGNTAFVISNLPTGGTATIIIVQDGTGSRTATFGTDTSTSVKFAGGTPTLSTAASSIDIVSIFNDGTNYYGDIGKAYA